MDFQITLLRQCHAQHSGPLLKVTLVSSIGPKWAFDAFSNNFTYNYVNHKCRAQDPGPLLKVTHSGQGIQNVLTTV